MVRLFATREWRNQPLASMKFQAGRLLATPGALRAIEEAGDKPATFLMRHLSGDWGELEAEDVRENELSLREGLRLLSAYRLADGTKILDYH
jgi:hypothetical protein